ncbi:MAG: HPP family protein [Hylemonella sp.]|nr:HPP family protein [Hylemonella sp.]
MHPLLPWLRSFWPAPLSISRREIWLGCLGAGLGLLGTEWLSHQSLGELNPWFIAPMGASAVLLFAVPASPLAQPWSILGGNLVSALIGVLCAHTLGHDGLAAGAAGALAIAAMFALRCLHPPGGAVALTAVLGGPAIAQLGYGYALWPVAANSALLLALALLFNNLMQRRYPHQPAPQPHPHRTADLQPSARLGLSKQDLDAALASQGQLLDISPDDLEEILTRAQLHASRRKWGDVLCRDIMSRDVVHVGPRDSVDEAWARLARHKVKALPVIRDDGTLAGIVSLHDFFVGHSSPDPRKMPVMSTARYVADIMTRKVRVARPEQLMVDLVSLFSDGGLHHMPVVDEQLRVVGMITQSDVVAALFKTGAG